MGLFGCGVYTQSLGPKFEVGGVGTQHGPFIPWGLGALQGFWGGLEGMCKAHARACTRSEDF